MRDGLRTLRSDSAAVVPVLHITPKQPIASRPMFSAIPLTEVYITFLIGFSERVPTREHPRVEKRGDHKLFEPRATDAKCPQSEDHLDCELPAMSARYDGAPRCPCGDSGTRGSAATADTPSAMSRIASNFVALAPATTTTRSLTTVRAARWRRRRARLSGSFRYVNR